MNSGPAAIAERIQPILLEIAELAPLEQVAERLAAAALELTSARYAAIGMYGDNGRLVRFITQGLDPGALARLGQPPVGVGLLGEFQSRTEAIRISSVADYPRHHGIPVGHPDMGPFLGVPVRRGDTALGAFYVTREPGGVQFTEEDERRLEALAPYAAMAMSNASIHERELRRTECASEIIRAAAELQTIETDRACASALDRALERLFPDNEHVVLLWPEEATNLDGHLRLPAESSLGERLIEMSDELSHGEHWFDDLLPDQKVFAYIGGADETALIALSCDRDTPLDEADRVALVQLTDVGAIGLSSVRRRAAVMALERYRTRDAIARDLHDDLIQSIYSIGLGLQTRRDDPDALGVALDRALHELNEVIRDLRAYIHQLEQGTEGLSSTGLLTTRIGGLLQRDTPTRWFRQVDLGDTALGAHRERQLYLIVREAVSNVHRHAQADRGSLILEQENQQVQLEISDNGIGFDRDSVSDLSVGLRSMEQRVADIGGSMIIESVIGQGTTLRATFPVDAEED
ncbi:MAG: GAF domain-containing protein [Dehalococcoidia bacterium]|nr:GAF domain-containing protein [Dehalococcoidia bacterium]